MRSFDRLDRVEKVNSDATITISCCILVLFAACGSADRVQPNEISSVGVPAEQGFRDTWRYSGVGRVVAISDIHGAFADMVLTLQKSAVIDNKLAWIGGETHLVITGDMIDRGAESRRVMDLMRRLEPEAIRAGGRVHVLLGNHEVMNLVGDLRYVSKAEYAAFSNEETAGERQFWYQQYLRNASADTDPALLLAEFAEKTPPGYFAHRRSFRSDGEYGKWLLEKPLMIVINDTAYVHGGIPPYVEDHGIEGVNDSLKADVLDYLAIRSTLENAGILSPVDSFRSYPSVLSAKIASGEIDEDLRALALQLIELKESPIHRPQGPLWYRGSSTCSMLVESDDLNAALRRIGAVRAVIGHTTTVSHLVQQRLKGRVIEINTGMLKPSYGGSGYALIIENGEVTVASQDGEPDLVPVDPPRRVGYESAVIDDDLIAGILKSGDMTDLQVENESRTLFSVVATEGTVFARFSPVQQQDGFAPELAAYRLDRMLELDMIPVTVSRDVDGRRGTLQFVPENTIGERERLIDDRGRDGPCPVAKQHRAIRMFDALIHNSDRTPLSILYSPDTGNLLLVGHDRSFAKDSDLPVLFQKDSFAIGAQWREALREISDQRLRENLGDVLDERRLEALGSRRDSLIGH